MLLLLLFIVICASASPGKSTGAGSLAVSLFQQALPLEVLGTSWRPPGTPRRLNIYLLLTTGAGFLDVNDVLIQSSFSYCSMLFYCEIKIKPKCEINPVCKGCVVGGKGREVLRVRVPCGRAGLQRKCLGHTGEACWYMGRGARQGPSLMVASGW